MNLPRNITLNTAARLVASFVDKALVLFVLALLARRLSSQGLGEYSFALAYIVFFRLLTDWGISPIAIKRLSMASEQGKSTLFGAALALRVVLAALAALLAGLSFSLGGAPSVIKASVWVATLTLADVITGVCSALLVAELKHTWLGALEAGNRLLWSAVAIATLLEGGGVFALLLVLGCSSLVQMTFAIWLSRSLLKFHLQFRWRLWRSLLSESWPLALQALMSTVYLRADQLMLYPLVGLTAVGYYSAATKIAEIWALFAGVFQAAVYPLMCKFYATDHERFEKTARYSFRYLFLGTFPFVIGCTLYAPAILRVAFGSPFSKAAPALILLVWADVFLVANMISQATLIAAGRERWTLLLSLAAAGSNVILNLLLIPRFGFVGAAWASLASYGMYLVTETLLTRTRPFALLLWKEAWRPFLAALATATLLVYLPSTSLRVVIGPATYVACLFAIRGLDSQDFFLARRALVGCVPGTSPYAPQSPRAEIS
jgi:O-antigen/teichoic acid export membrane protein